MLARRQGCLLAQILAAFDRDPQAILSEIALIRYEDSLARARALNDLGAKERAPALRKLTTSPDFDDRLVLALAAHLKRQAR